MPRSEPPPALQHRRSDLPHYQTFPTKPPTSRGKPQHNDRGINTPTSASGGGTGSRPHTSSSGKSHASPLPTVQLMVLAVIALAEQTALNSIAPYLPDMVSTFPEVQPALVGTYVGSVASAFALAQFVTNFFWGWLSDRIGRKPVILIGTILTSACFIAFGFCRTLWQAILVQSIMGLVNGNQGVVSTCLGEITDRSNQSRAFIYLPVVYGIGAITGPVVGGLMVRVGDPEVADKYPYLPPNLLSAALLFVEWIVTMIFMEESLEEVRDLAPLGERVGQIFVWLWQFTAFSRKPTYTRPGSSGAAQRASISRDTRPDFDRRGLSQVDDEGYTSTDSGGSGSDTAFNSDQRNSHSHSRSYNSGQSSSGHHTRSIRVKDILNKDTVLILGTFLIFQFSNIAYNSLYPIFAQAASPTGRSLTPEEIGVSLGFAGLVTIVFQIGLFGRLREKVGNKTTYRVSLFTFVVAFALTPWIGYRDSPGGSTALYFELGAVLVIKTVASVGGLTSALLLITNSAPDPAVLGTLNGLAQTLSAAGRAIGPFLSGGLFSLAIEIRPKGEVMAFGVFAGVAVVGLIISFWIQGNSLEEGGEIEDEEGSGGSTRGSSDGDEAIERGGRSPADERSGLLSRR